MNWTDHKTLLCIRACNVGFIVFDGLVHICVGVVIGLTPSCSLSCSLQAKGDCRKVKQSELELHKHTGRGCSSPSRQNNNNNNNKLIRAKLVHFSGTTETKRTFVPQCLNLSTAIPYRLILDSTKCTKADLNSQQLEHFGLPLRTPEIVFPMTYTSKFLGGGGWGGGLASP